MSFLLKWLGGSLGPYIAGGIAALVLLLLAAVWGLTVVLGHTREDLKIANGRVEVAQAQAAAAKQAGLVIDAVGQQDTANDQITKENHDAITSAPGAGQSVDPAGDDTARRAICLRHAARCTPGCVQLLGAGSCVVAKRGSQR